MARGLRSLRWLAICASALIGLVLSAGPVQAGPTTNWPQWGQNPQHQGNVSVAGQSLNRTLATVLYDPNVPAEQAASGGDLLAHYQAPLLHQNDVFMEFKTGPFTTPDAWQSQTWHEKRLHWESGALVEKWDYASSWKPVPNGPGNGQGSRLDRLGLGGWEPVFHAVLANGSIYVPSANGVIVKLATGDGSLVSTINPGYTTAANTNTFVAGPLSADDAGNVYFNAIQLDATDPWGGASGTDVSNSWLVKVASDDSSQIVSYKSLVSGAPTTCTTTYNTTTDVPWPNYATKPPSGPCGSQRVGLNVAPAIAPDGTIYSVSRAHLRSRYSYLLAVNPDLTSKWHASLRDGGINDGCGVLLPNDNGVVGCRTGSPQGVDPATNEPPAGRVIDQSSSSPTVAPDGSVLYGAYSRYNFAKGHTFKFDASGKFLAYFDFGWDSTPAIYPHGGTYSIVIKDNHYAAPCCPGTGPPSDERFFISQLSATQTEAVPNTPPGSSNRIKVEWQFQNVNFVPPDNPNGFEWCINAPAVDANGVVYANSEDGSVYAINQGGTLKQKMFLRTAIGAAYTPLSIAANGLLYTENSGYMLVIGT
jgi:hypothetical protein